MTNTYDASGLAGYILFGTTYMGYQTYSLPLSYEAWVNSGCYMLGQTADQQDDFDGHSVAPGGSAHPAGHRPYTEETDSAAERSDRAAARRSRQDRRAMTEASERR